MRSSGREEIVEAFDALEADLDRALALSFDALIFCDLDHKNRRVG